MITRSKPFDQIKGFYSLKDTIMASNPTFLPFIKESSSEEAIFKALLQRTKGSTTKALTNLFSVVLSVGIESVRTKMDSLGHHIPNSNKLSQVVAQETKYHIPQSERTYWSYVAKHVLPEVSNFSKDDLTVFFTVLAVVRPETLAINNIIISTTRYEKLKEFSKEEFDPGIASVKNVDITEDSNFRVGFTCWEEFKAFLAMKTDNKTDTKVLPAYIKTDASTITAHIYAENHCASPYIGESDET